MSSCATSSWGLAGVLCINGAPAEVYSDAISTLDVALFEHNLCEAEASKSGSASQHSWSCACGVQGGRSTRCSY